MVVDHWQGRAYISLVGLRFEGLRVFGIPVLPNCYDEVNLRFYVRRAADGDDERPGVVFIRQLVPHRLTALVARVVYGEPFETAPVEHDFSACAAQRTGRTACVAYHWEAQGRRQRFWASADGPPMDLPPGSLGEFLTSRYWGYNGATGNGVKTYHLTRPPWPVRQASRWGIECDFSEVFGSGLAAAMGEAPASVLLATGSRAAVSLPVPLAG